MVSRESVLDEVTDPTEIMTEIASIRGVTLSDAGVIVLGEELWDMMCEIEPGLRKGRMARE